jgi:hydrogenase/urease accessory protein HupE
MRALFSVFSPVLAVLAVLYVLVLAFPASAAAHPLAPSLLEIRETAGGRAAVLWKMPLQRPAGADPRPVLPAACRPAGLGRATVEETALVTRWTVDCGPAGLAGAEIGVEGLAAVRSDVLLRVTRADGSSVRAVLRAEASVFRLPRAQRPLDVAGGYLALGIEHLLTGADHLLFLLGLMLLVRERRRLLATVTAFTLGHSVTLSLAALGIVHIPSAPAEAAIALSILVLAVELARDRPGALSRRPWAMAAAFGLLHGLGFAGALAEIGLPAREIPLALVSFNTGIELGQITFLIAVAAVLWLARPAARRLPVWSAAVPVYLIGTLAAYWFFERLAAM